MTQRRHRTVVVAAMTTGLAMLASTAFAQTQPATPPQQAPAQNGAPAGKPDTGPTPNDAELKDFAHAVMDVQSIKQTVQPKLSAAKTPDDRTKVEQAAEKQMEAAIQKHDLSLQRYVQIAKVVQQNDAIRAKVQGYMTPQPSKS